MPEYETRQTLGKFVQTGDYITKIIGQEYKVIAITHPDDDHLLFSIIREGQAPIVNNVVRSHVNEIHNVRRLNWD